MALAAYLDRIVLACVNEQQSAALHHLLRLLSSAACSAEYMLSQIRALDDASPYSVGDRRVRRQAVRLSLSLQWRPESPVGHLYSKLRTTQENRLVFGRSLHKPAHHLDICN